MEDSAVETAQTTQGATPAPATEPTPKEPSTFVEPAPKQEQPFKLDPKSTTPALDLAMHYLEQQGIKTSHPLYQSALESGDFSAIEGFLLGKGCKDASPYLNIIKQEFNTYKQEVAQQEQEIDAVIQSVVPSEELESMVSWLKETASEEELQEILRIGETKTGALMMAKLLYPMFKEANSQGYVSAPMRQEAGDSVPAWVNLPASTGGDTPMTQGEYIDAVRSLEKKIGRHNMNDSVEYKRLQARFAKSLK